MKIEEKDAKELFIRRDALSKMQVVFEMAKNDLDNYTKGLFKKIGLEEGKKYNINAETLEVVEVKEEKEK